MRPVVLGWMLVVLCACGADGGDTPSADAARDSLVASDAPLFDGAAPHDSAGPPNDTRPDQDTAAPLDVNAGPVPVGVGVLVGEIDSAYVNVAFAVARFTRVVPPTDTSGTVYGPCRVTAVNPDAPAASSYGLDAGVVTVANTSPVVTLSPASEGVYGTGYASSLAEDQRDLLPTGGAIVTLSGQGGADIAAFSGALQVPEPVTLGAPATGLTATADAAKPLGVIWNAGTGTSVLVSLTPVSTSGQPVAGQGIFCTVTGDPGQLTIPSAALGAALGGSGAVAMALGVTRTKSGSVSNAGHRIPVTATRSTGGPISLRYN